MGIVSTGSIGRRSIIGLRLIMISILISIVLWFLGTFHKAYLYFLFDPFEISTFFYILINYGMWILSFLASITGLLLTGIGIFLLKKDADDMESKHFRNMRIAWISFWIIILISLLLNITSIYIRGLFWTGIPTITQFLIADFMTNTMVWISTVLLLLVRILPLREISRKRQWQMALFYAVGILSLVIFQDISIKTLLILFPSSEFITHWVIPIIPIILSVIRLSLLFLLFRAYLETIRLNKGAGKKTRSVMKRTPWMLRTFNKGLKRPVRMIIVITLAASILSTALTILYYNEATDLFNDKGSNEEPETTYLKINATEEIISFSGFLYEGMTSFHIVEIEGNVSRVVSELKWTDENDLIRRENHPDKFEINMTWGNSSDISEDINPRGEEGSISVSIDKEGSNVMLNVSITLIDAGDQIIIDDPGGYPLVDDHNEYTLTVYVDFQDEN